MRSHLKTIAVAAALLGAAAPAFAQSQLVANAGLTPAEARGLTLNEIAVAKFNRNAGNENRQGVVPRGDVTAASRSVANGAHSQLAANAGLTPEEARGLTLNEIAVAKFNRNAGNDNRQGVVRRSEVTLTSRSFDGAARSQLAASAGLTPDEARGKSLTDIAAEKFARDTYN
jgi:hypothetical protein